MAYRVKLEQFEGPLDLLLHLIERAELDIKDIFISEITAEYLSYMDAVDELDMDTASEFLTMAATLLYIKSRQLLPRPRLPDVRAGTDLFGFQPPAGYALCMHTFPAKKHAAANPLPRHVFSLTITLISPFPRRP